MSHDHAAYVASLSTVPAFPATLVYHALLENLGVDGPAVFLARTIIEVIEVRLYSGLGPPEPATAAQTLYGTHSTGLGSSAHSVPAPPEAAARPPSPTQPSGPPSTYVDLARPSSRARRLRPRETSPARRHRRLRRSPRRSELRPFTAFPRSPAGAAPPQQTRREYVPAPESSRSATV